jgi:D-glycero-beta-D-manno-heptose 1-phosphate adenylyltransferase
VLHDGAKVDRIRSVDELRTWRQQMAVEGKMVVLTNGTFDLLHIGHVRYLQEAAAMGDALIVGVNSDRSVRGYKGPNRPVVPERERAEIVAALRCVSYVTIFDEPTATELAQALKPDIYVKGGDYSPGGKELPEREAVERHGGEVRIVPLVAGHSASELIRRAGSGS